MRVPKNAEKFLGSEVVKWKKKDFIKHFESRFSNAESIYDYYSPKKKVSKED